ncbi:MAG: hypothetical protein ACRD4D_01190, partial [Candidatus Acidiferrales bacterium]
MTDNWFAPPPEPVKERPLESWKEIAAYLKRDIRTVKRWEKSEGLPVRRHQHQARASVYAYPSELESWKANRDLPKEERSGIPWRRPASALAMAAVFLLALVTVASGPLVHPPGAAAQEGGIVARQVASSDHLPTGFVSPDGKFFTDVDWTTGDLVLSDPATLKILRRLTRKGSWAESPEYAEFGAVSPDGTQVAYAWFNGNGYDLRLVSVEGGEPRVLYRPPDTAYVAHGFWSPDGQYYAVTISSGDRTNKILLVKVADGSAMVLKSTDWRFPSLGPFSPDGKYILYSFPPADNVPERDVFALAVDGSREVRVTEHPAQDTVLGWTPDGEKLLFFSDRTGSRSLWAVGFANRRVQGVPELLKADVGRIQPFGFTKDGSFYYGISTSFRDAYLARMDSATNRIFEPQRVTEKFLGSTSWPGWSADGKLMVYATTHGQPWHAQDSLILAIRNVETGEERELNPKLRQAHPFGVRPVFTPDGSAILLAATDGKRRQGIYRVEVRTGEATLMVDAGPTALLKIPALSPDGQTLFYLRHDLADQKASVVLREMKSGREQELTVMAAARPRWIIHFSPSPDGQTLAAIVGDREARSQAVVVLSASGGEPRELIRVQDPEFLSGQTGVVWT